jgi:hypothetical protein
VRHRHQLVADPAGARGAEWLAQVQRQLVPLEIEVHPGVRAAPFAAAQHVAVEAARDVEVRHVEGEVE